MGISPDSDLGGEVYERELLLRIPKYGGKLRLILPKNSKIREDMVFESINYLPISRRLRWFVSNPLYFNAIKKNYAEGGFDLLRVHSLRFIGPAAIMFRSIYGAGIPLIGHHHHIDPEVLSFIIDRRVASSLDLIITVSEFSKKQIINDYGVEEDRIVAVYNGVDDKYKPLPKDPVMENKYGTNGKKVLMYVGGMKKRKNLSFLLECLAEIRKEFSQEWLCLIFGRGEELASLKRKCETLGISNLVRFCGYLPEEEKCRVLNICDIYVFPSLLEGFGMAAVEAMACGKPVVGLNTASLPEIIDNDKTGLLSVPGDKRAYINSVLLLLKDEKLREKLGNNARGKTEKCYSWDESARKVMGHYETVTERFRKSVTDTQRP